MRRRLISTLAALALAPSAGCLGEAAPLSPTPEQDPASFVRSVTEMEDVARRNREAEARFFRKVRASQTRGPEDGPATGFDPDQPNTAQVNP